MASNPRWLPLFSTNFMGVLNDNFLKTSACFIAVFWVGIEYESLLVTAASAALVLPYIFLSPLAGRWAEIYNKITVVRIAKASEILIMLLASWGFLREWPWIVIGCIFLMGLQSCMFSPSKYGLIRDIGGYENIGIGTGGMEMTAFVGMLCGTLLAAFTANTLPIKILCLIFLGVSIAGLLCSFLLQARESLPAPRGSGSLRPFKYLKDCYIEARNYKDLNSLILGLSVFWLIAGLMQMLLIVYCRRNLFMSDMQTGCVLATAAVGIGAGCFTAGLYAKRRWSYGLVIPGGGISVVLLLLIYILSPKGWLFGLFIFLIAFCMGLFKVPLDASISEKVPGRKLGLMFGYSNQLSFIFILLASACFGIISRVAGLHLTFLFTALLLSFTLLFLFLFSRDILIYSFKHIFSMAYKVELKGREVMDGPGSRLLLPNHTAIVDPPLLITRLYSYPICPLTTERYFRSALLRTILRRVDAIPVPDLTKTRRHDKILQVQALPALLAARLSRGCNLLLYPAGELSAQKEEKIKNKQMAWTLCRQLPSNTRVIGVRIEGMWGSMWSKAATSTTPELLPTTAMAIVKLLRYGIFFAPKRKIKITLQDITAQALEKAADSKEAFNGYLETFYNYL